jgi:hypothetical protein
MMEDGDGFGRLEGSQDGREGLLPGRFFVGLRPNDIGSKLRLLQNDRGFRRAPLAIKGYR